VETNEQAGPSDGYCIAYNRIRQLQEQERARLAGEEVTPTVDCAYVVSGYFGDCVCPGNKYVCEVSHGGNKRCRLSSNATLDFDDCRKGCK
jgi:hypothetical protein